MTAAETRAAVLAYHRLRHLLTQPLDAALRQRIVEMSASIEEACQGTTNRSAPSRWARQQVGPVLAAGLGASAWMRSEVPSAVAALRIFGLAGERSLSPLKASKIMQPYLWEPALSDSTVAEIRRRCGLRLQRLPANPSPIDLLVELTRPRSDGVSSRMP